MACGLKCWCVCVCACLWLGMIYASWRLTQGTINRASTRAPTPTPTRRHEQGIAPIVRKSFRVRLSEGRSKVGPNVATQLPQGCPTAAPRRPPQGLNGRHRVLLLGPQKPARGGR
eukprot:1735554-Alexandrium_andersonii.AAC.2